MASEFISCMAHPMTVCELQNFSGPEYYPPYLSPRGISLERAWTLIWLQNRLGAEPPNHRTEPQTIKDKRDGTNVDIDAVQGVPDSMWPAFPSYTRLLSMQGLSRSSWTCPLQWSPPHMGPHPVLGPSTGFVEIAAITWKSYKLNHETYIPTIRRFQDKSHFWNSGMYS